MKLILTRTDRRDDGIFSELTHEDGELVAYALEHSYFSGAMFEPKIPLGDYKCKRGTHQLHGMDHTFETFEVMGVKDHSGILFHWGNYNKDSAGCILLGTDIVKSDPWMVTESRKAFNKFMLLLDGEDSFDLAVNASTEGMKYE